MLLRRAACLKPQPRRPRSGFMITNLWASRPAYIRKERPDVRIAFSPPRPSRPQDDSSHLPWRMKSSGQTCSVVIYRFHIHPLRPTKLRRSAVSSAP